MRICGRTTMKPFSGRFRQKMMKHNICFEKSSDKRVHVFDENLQMGCGVYKSIGF